MFVKHIACTACGSSDANALYSDGGTFCWSCRTPKKGTMSPYAITKEGDSTSLALPDDCGFDYPEHVLNWVLGYGLGVSDLISNGVVYSAYRDQLIYTWRDEQGQMLLWQARNFSKEAKQKCYTKGTPNDVLPIYPGQTGLSTFVIVEDPISAIKVARHSGASMPVLGSDLPMDKLKRLAGSLEAFLGLSDARVVVWLDGNMYHKAQKMVQRLQMLGVEAKAVYTEDDPKAINDTEIKKMLDNI